MLTHNADTYAKLSPRLMENEIRLLKLDGVPRRQSPNETPLTGELRTVSMSNSPSFTALSYAWGSQSPSQFQHQIMLKNQSHNHPLKISSSLNDALSILRDTYGSISIWIDAVCINQDDDEEKCHQILLMREIFTWATTVYVFLGKGNSSTDAAMDWLVSVTILERPLIGTKSRGSVNKRYVHPILQLGLDSRNYFCT